MTPSIAVVAGTPTWRRGSRAVLSDLGFDSVELETLAEWTLGRGGAAVLLWVDAEAESTIPDFVEAFPQIPVVAMFPRLDLDTAAAVIRSGASAVLAESDPVPTIGAALTASMSGLAVLPRQIALAMSDRVPEGSTFDWISREQSDWLIALAEGVTVGELADRIGWSERETFRMLGDLYRHLGVRNRTEAIIWAARHGLVG
jgi:DNA-binding NarL/FixJ family response regulator